MFVPCQDYALLIHFPQLRGSHTHTHTPDWAPGLLPEGHLGNLPSGRHHESILTRCPNEPTHFNAKEQPEE